MFPILGAIRMSHAAQPPDEPPLYTLFQRREAKGGGHERCARAPAAAAAPTRRRLQLTHATHAATLHLFTSLRLRYEPVGAFLDAAPTAAEITQLVPQLVEALD